VAVETTERRLESIREQLAPPWTDNEERVVETGAIPIAVEKRGHWYHLEDRGEAWRVPVRSERRTIGSRRPRGSWPKRVST
jgi:hypothetical protein